MRLPSFNQLSKEQDLVCVSAPLEGAVLVSGPPGSGKTVVAFYRANTLARTGRAPTVVMFNKVLSRFTTNCMADIQGARGLTWDSWLGKWWGSVFRGKWVPTRIVDDASPGHHREKDWAAMLEAILSLDEQGWAKARKATGTLVLDEGQDFPKDFYHMLRLVLASPPNGECSVSAFADENQRLTTGRNSTLDEVEKALALPRERHYTLTRNYRNSRPIAELAASFYVGLKTGIPELPDRKGTRPRLAMTEDMNKAVDIVERYVRNNEDLEVGVFLGTKKLRRSFQNKLAHRFERKKQPSIVIQGYDSDDEDGAEKLQFDRKGTVTMLCDQSAKGIEFDAVFVPELQARQYAAGHEEILKMQLYVLSSRARSHLQFMASAPSMSEVPLLKLFPLRETGLLEWSDGA